MRGGVPEGENFAVLNVSRLCSDHDVEKIRDEWVQLHEESGSVNPFLGPEWTVHWMRNLMSETDEAWVLTVRDAGRLVGVAPLHLHTYRPGIRRLQMIGSGQPWVGPLEMPALLAARGYGRQVARVVTAHLGEHHRSWHLASVSLGETGDWLEPGWLPAEEFTVLNVKSTPYVVLQLPIADRGPGEGRRNLREAVRRARNRLTKQFGADGWTVEGVRDPSVVRTVFEDLVDLHRRRAEYTERGNRHPDQLADPRVRSYLLTVVSELAERGGVTIYRLLAGGHVLAAQLVLHTRTATFISVSGFRGDAWGFSPTNYLQWVAVNDAADRGHSEVNFSAWPTEAKLRWSRTVRGSTEFLVIGPARFSKLVAAPTFLVASALSSYRRELGVRNLRQLARRVVAPSRPAR